MMNEKAMALHLLFYPLPPPPLKKKQKNKIKKFN